MKRVAVVLFNLGGPDKLSSVRPFLFNLFNDPAIIRAPKLIRFFIALLISTLRTQKAKEIYKLMGGASPLLKNTQAQAEALEELLNQNGSYNEYKVFMAMRYWHPRAIETAQKVAEYNPHEMVLLPLYPQFSTTTTESSFKEWREVFKGSVPTRTLCCFPFQEDFLKSHAKLIEDSLNRAAQEGSSNPLIIFSAHSLPQKIIDDGDPYQWQVEQTALKIMDIIRQNPAHKEAEFTVTYQSRVGPVKWLEPQTEEVIRKKAKEGLALLVVPIAFVSDHSETLVELDIEYKEMALEAGCPYYGRVPSLGIDPLFIKSLADLVEEALNRGEGKAPRICPKGWCRCYQEREGLC